MNDIQRGILGATIVGVAGIIGGPALALIGFMAVIVGIKTLGGSSRARHTEDEQDKEPTGVEWPPLASPPRWHRPEFPRADLREQYRFRTPNHEELVTSLNDEDENLNEPRTPQRSAEPSMRNEAYFERQRQRRR